MARNSARGYGAYWKGHVKNKTIARRNKQYIADQRCFAVYKKIQERQGDTDAPHVHAENVGGIKAVSSDSVPVTRPRIVYENAVMSTEGVNCGAVSDLYPSRGLTPLGGSGTPFTESQIQDRHLRVQGGALTSEDVALSSLDLASKSENITSSNEKASTSKHSLYSKAIAKRREIQKQRQSEANSRLEAIKRDKRERYLKRRDRYNRFRLLGKFTKKGQPIMANVISHLMHKYKRGDSILKDCKSQGLRP